MPTSAQYTPPGQLGKPDMTLGDDPRVNFKLAELMKGFGMSGALPPTKVSPTESLETLHEAIAEQSKGTVALYEAVDLTTPGDENEPKVERSDLEIDSADGNKVKLHVFRRADTKGQTLPCVVYTHGGGMTIIDTINQVHVRWLTSLAITGVVAIAVDFRNAWTPEGRNAFPAGLNDCAAGVQYVASHKSELGISKIVVQGESGGGNLAIATGLKAKREGWISSIDGIYGLIPYISNGYHWSKGRKLEELPSLVENDGYVVTTSAMALLSAYYTYEEKDKTNPLAWPYHATVEELKGLPPHVIHVDELDPLRDEGMAFYRKLSKAGVSVAGKMNLGLMHGTEVVFRNTIPEFHDSVIQSVAAFVKGL